MIKNFLASEVGLRKETLTFEANVEEGKVVAYTDSAEGTRYGVVYNDVTLGTATKKIGSIVVAGHVIVDKVDFGALTKADVIEACVAQGLFFEAEKETTLPEDLFTE